MSDEFADKLERLRNHFFHYARLIGAAPEHEELLRALDTHADLDGEIRMGELFKDFRAHFADDVAAGLTMTDEDAAPFVAELAAMSSAAMNFAYVAVCAHARLPPRTLDPIG